jgi:hypothetical protein
MAGWETDTGVVKIGDGSTAYNSLSKLIHGNRRAQVSLAADLTGINATAGYTIPFTSESGSNDEDVGGWHDNSTNNTRLTVPSGVTRIRVGANIRITDVTSGSPTYFLINKNGSYVNGCPTMSMPAHSNVESRASLVSRVLTVTAGDYFEAAISITGDTSVTVAKLTTFFWIEEAG